MEHPLIEVGVLNLDKPQRILITLFRRKFPKYEGRDVFVRVKDLMDTEFPLLIPQQTIIEALNILSDWGISAAPVVNNKCYKACFIVDEQIIKHLLTDWNKNYLVSDLMKTEITIVQEEQKIGEISPTNCPIIPVMNTKGQITGVLWIHKLASLKLEHISQQENIHEINDVLNTIIQSSHEGIVISDEEGFILRVNRATESIINYTAQELLGKNARRLSELGVIIRSVTEEVLCTQKPATIKQTNTHGREYIATGTPIFKPNGLIYRVVTTLRDITVIGELQEALEDTRAQSLKFVSNQMVFRNQKMSETGIITKSEAMIKLVDLALKVAQFDATVLISGESGVGKELIAKLIHNASLRAKEGQFIKVNCGAIPRDLLESEFFGYVQGAFTGAKKEGKLGYFELADQGTLFLDEIGELNLDLQVKLLRVIQEHELVRLGDTNLRKIDVKIIAATNRDLHKMVIDGTFREDLYYRLNVLPIHIPPLRSRPEDITVLLTTFLEKFSRRYGIGKMFSGDCLALLCRYKWPGNVRELENVVERLVITTDEHIITPQHLPLQVYQAKEPIAESAIIDMPNDNRFIHETHGEMRTLQEVIDEVEKEMINKALQIYGNTYRAARILGVSQSTIARKAKKYHQKNERSWHEETV
ncbi:MAG: hypothetical protein APF81_20950 [Desulfosporosinus sp. BRH_c37]|nr:MAG: hypothetical protein APF81_20950 [Desulfosporosinus sp. BRH_c37]